ncbi:MAG: beta-galactosidase GalA [Deltaproteobacteria bacterium]
MNRYLLIIPVVLSFISIITSQKSISSLDENWKFHLGHAADPVKDFNHGIGHVFIKTTSVRNTPVDFAFNDSTWRTVDLPHDWAVELPYVYSDNFDVMSHGYKPVGGLFPETSIGWYRKYFSIDTADSLQHFQLKFDGVFRDADFWINGFYLGNNKSGYMGVTYDITDFVNFDKENVIVVRVDATQYEGWFYEGAGIYRHVWLLKSNDVRIADDGIFLYSSQNKGKAVVSAEIEIENLNSKDNEVKVVTEIYDRNGKLAGKSKAVTTNINGLKSNVLKQDILIKNPVLWDIENPYLYNVIVSIYNNGELAGKVQTRFGIRSIEIKPNGVFLNGKHIKLKGTNNHQDHAGVGSALPDYLQYYRIRLLKDMGCNTIRTSHHPPTPELLDACDSLGMLVMDETRLLNSGSEYIDQFKRMLKRDRSRTSVFIWSIGNEEGWVQANSKGKKIAETMIAVQKIMDPTRICTYGADLPQRGNMPNIFAGISEIIPVRGFNYREDAVESYHKAKPHQPIIGTEMGSTVTTRGIYEKDTVKCYLPDKDVTAPWWASLAEKWLPLASENDYWLGGYIWTGFDYRGEPTPFQWPNINSHFGVMDMCGFPKNLYYYYQSWWSDKDVLHILPHWNWKGKEGLPIDVRVYSNADKVELFLNSKSLGLKEMPRYKHLQWTVNYESGELKAIAYKKDRTYSTVRETSGIAAGTLVTAYKTTMIADGKDATIINITAVDNRNREVPDADNLIYFSVKGDARIIGVGNGDPSSHEPDKCQDGQWQRRLFNGKCQLILQAGKTPGTIIVEVKSDGLWDNSAEIFSIPLQQSSFSDYEKKPSKRKTPETGNIIGADISFLPELEDKGIKFSDKGIYKDAIEILKDHGFNYVRLRIFNDPAGEKGYSPEKGFCDLNNTLAMAKRVKKAGMKLLLDFHYSDYWADPGKQYKPAAWQNISFEALRDSVYNYTANVIRALKQQGTTPDMVQIGNEINHGMLWPEGHVNNLDRLAQLFKSGHDAVLSIDPSIIIMLHIALGGQNDETVFFIDNMLKRGVEFDVIGQSYYPQWHGTLDDLKHNLHNMLKRYDKDLIVVEYSSKKMEVNDIIFNLPRNKGKGSFIWEPLNTWEYIFEPDGRSNSLIEIYDEVKRKYLNY